MAKKVSIVASAPLPRPPPAPDEGKAIEQAVLDVSNRLPRFTVDFTQKPDGSIDALGSSHADQAGWLKRLENVFGTRGQAFAVSQLNHLMSLCRDADKKISATTVMAC